MLLSQRTDATALDTAIHMRDPQPAVVQRLATWLLGGHQELDLGQGKRQEAQILQPPTPRGQGIRRRLGHRLLMDTAAVGVAQEEDEEQDIFDGVVLFFPL
jgi:hypothetical protein